MQKGNEYYLRIPSRLSNEFQKDMSNKELTTWVLNSVKLEIELMHII